MTIVKAVSVRAFELFAADGTQLGLFVVESNWQGMTQLRSVANDAVTVIIDHDVRNQFGEYRGEYSVVKASPDLCAKLKQGEVPA